MIIYQEIGDNNKLQITDVDFCCDLLREKMYECVELSEDSVLIYGKKIGFAKTLNRIYYCPFCGERIIFRHTIETTPS